MQAMSSLSKLRLPFAITVLTLSFSSAQAGIKCWTNSDSIRECGNSIPPEYSQQGHKHLSSHGVTIKSTQRAKTKAELDEAARLAIIEREKQRLIQQQKEADQLLLDTFASADDIILAREGKLSALKSEILLRKSVIDKLKANLDHILVTAADMERRGERPTEKILKDIRTVRTQIAENKRHILTKKQEQEDVKLRYADDLNRYNKLHEGSI